MNHDVRLSGIKDSDLRYRRIGALAAVLVLFALLAVLALAAPHSRSTAPSGTEFAAGSPVAPDAQAVGEENAGYPMECTAALSASGAECLYY